MGRTASSRRWLEKRHADPYVKLAKAGGYRSRAAFKLKEILERDRILRFGSIVIDLGAAPGGWSQVAVQAVGKQGRVIAVDRDPMVPVPGVTILQGDLNESATIESIKNALGDRRADMLLCDMAPNLSGIAVTDQGRVAALAETAMNCAEVVLKRGGDMLIKVFQGEDWETVQRRLRSLFHQVLLRKPKASRARSAEGYALCRSYESGARG